MGSRLVAAALAVALLGCGGAETKPSGGASEGGGDEVAREEVQVDRLGQADCKAAASEFGRKVSEQRAAGRAIQVVRVDRVKNESGDLSFDVETFRRAVEDELTAQGLEVLAAPNSQQARDDAEARAYADATGGASEMDALEQEKRPDATIMLLASSERRGEGARRYELTCQLIDRKLGKAIVTTTTTIQKTQE